ncbi:hypothetical protein B0T25DRAFT_10730 [Lasiosphaeria hispida]|uniref:Uncharacterized protein n=1 Tax=Lasiosphaeria hispida TaxID=260671 RepID=A0AAJ0MJC8_9PEZI|nr:hypothetical protein B0T25DRAFT_10730 [Lasiosphaeria hispida]
MSSVISSTVEPTLCLFNVLHLSESLGPTSSLIRQHAASCSCQTFARALFRLPFATSISGSYPSPRSLATPTMASSADSSETTPLADSNLQLQSYYLTLSSRVGYRLLLGGTQHFGFWDNDTFHSPSRSR